MSSNQESPAVQDISYGFMLFDGNRIRGTFARVLASLLFLALSFWPSREALLLCTPLLSKLDYLPRTALLEKAKAYVRFILIAYIERNPLCGFSSQPADCLILAALFASCAYAAKFRVQRDIIALLQTALSSPFGHDSMMRFSSMMNDLLDHSSHPDTQAL